MDFIVPFPSSYMSMRSMLFEVVVAIRFFQKRPSELDSTVARAVISATKSAADITGTI